MVLNSIGYIPHVVCKTAQGKEQVPLHFPHAIHDS